MGYAVKTITTLSGSCNTSGNNLLLAGSTVSGSITLTQIVLQNETTASQIMLLRFGTSNILRLLAYNQGDGYTAVFEEGREPMTGSDIFLNLSSASTVNYSLWYYTRS